MSVVFVSFTQEKNSCVTKKRVIEKTKSDTRPVFDINRLFPRASADPLQVDIDGPAEPQQDPSMESRKDPAKRAVSVSPLFCCHVTRRLHAADQACRMAAISLTVPHGAPPS